MTRSIGIDSIALAVPEGFLDLRDLAAARNVDPAKYTEGLAVDEMAVAARHEDTVALAARAAQRALVRGDVDRARIGLCVVGTETAVDHSKPVAAWLHRLLELPDACRTFETKHACFGGTAGVLAAVDWIASGSARGRAALVVCSDIARYPLGSAGEPTQGAGAVALVIREDPRLVALEPGVTGSFSRDVDDIWRPLWSRDALVDGHVSVTCYLDALAGAHASWREACRELSVKDEPVARRCYHVPYGKMARKAHAKLCALEGIHDVDGTFAREVASSLRLPRRVGNVYTGSLWLSLASMLETDASDVEGRRISLFSYGSGCTSELFCGRVVQGAARHVASLAISEPLAHRRRLTFAEYENIRRADGDIDATADASGGAAGALAFLGVERGRRVYG